MIELIKRTKLVYAVYNFFHKRELAHNVPLYKKLGFIGLLCRQSV
ncbi:hypothetical protein [Agriterribacter sp.]|nr:hypothetical protein [Agriterribacter sp.]HRO47186.1 hypothetical protein [Agriterribacter sp.]HRQ18713.1 hypothetical protein [Agriterribacter sp.]